MNIKNYTSTVTTSVSMSNIEKWLVEIGATNINKQYKDKICTGIMFLYIDPQLAQTLTFNLAAQVDECFSILWKEVKRPQADTRKKIMEQAARTAWKILSDWTEVQCSMILLGQAKPLQMFLPFVYDMKSGTTFYDRVINDKSIKLLN